MYTHRQAGAPTACCVVTRVSGRLDDPLLRRCVLSGGWDYHVRASVEMFESRAKANGVIVHRAQDAHEHNQIVYQLLSERNMNLLAKAKSMLTEECETTHFLENRGIRVAETDLGERIQQLDDEPPSHIVGPSWHKTPQDVAVVFARAYGSDKSIADPAYLAGVMRANTRPIFVERRVVQSRL
jgi:L-lactate dehydrogenase complex protein LldF